MIQSVAQVTLGIGTSLDPWGAWCKFRRSRHWTGHHILCLWPIDLRSAPHATPQVVTHQHVTSCDQLPCRGVGL